MPSEAQILSHERIERLEAWVKAHCPCALDDPGFLPALVVIVDAEIRTEFARVCWKHLRLLSEPCQS